MNDRVRLPNYIVIVPDADIVKYINFYNFGFRNLAEREIKWIATEIKKKLDERKDALWLVRKGTILSRQRKIVWIEMIDRIHIKDRYLAMRTKFNGAMHAILSDFRDNYIMSVNRAMFNAELYTTEGKLNNKGKRKFTQR